MTAKKFEKEIIFQRIFLQILKLTKFDRNLTATVSKIIIIFPQFSFHNVILIFKTVEIYKRLRNLK